MLCKKDDLLECIICLEVRMNEHIYIVSWQGFVVKSKIANTQKHLNSPGKNKTDNITSPIEINQVALQKVSQAKIKESNSIKERTGLKHHKLVACRNDRTVRYVCRDS